MGTSKKLLILGLLIVIPIIVIELLTENPNEDSYATTEHLDRLERNILIYESDGQDLTSSGLFILCSGQPPDTYTKNQIERYQKLCQRYRQAIEKQK